MLEFGVIDPKTGGYPDVEKIARTEEWAKNLIYCDIDTFAVTEDGTLILLDDCGNVAYCPEGRFKIVKPTIKDEICKIELALISEGQKDTKFRWGEEIRYTPHEVAEILRKHADELI